MGGGILQLAALGSADIAIVGNPQVTFFKSLHKRHSLFSMESIEQSWNGTADFGRSVTSTIARTGDLVTNMYLEITLPDLSEYTYTAVGGASVDPATVKYVNSIGHALLKSVELEVGGFRVDKHVAEWMDVWHELSEPEEKRRGFNEMIGKYEPYDPADPNKSSGAERTYYIPLLFYFNRNYGNALPLISLQFHQCRVLVEFRSYLECLRCPTAQLLSASGPDGNPLGFKNAKVYVDYIYLEQTERRRYSQIPHEYLIEQTQFLGDVPVLGFPEVTQKVSLNFSHPVKELVWVYTSEFNYRADTRYGNDIFNYSLNHANDPGEPDDNVAVPPTEDVFDSVQLFLNGTERFSQRKGSYFRLVQPYQHHTRTPSRPVYCYSYALHPENHQPSGHVNLSRLENAHFVFSLNPKVTRGRIKVFAFSYNVLRISSGLAGIAYAG
jgi:hypothetical protein